MEPPYGALLGAAGFVDFQRFNPNAVLREFYQNPGAGKSGIRTPKKFLPVFHEGNNRKSLTGPYLGVFPIRDIFPVLPAKNPAFSEGILHIPGKRTIPDRHHEKRDSLMIPDQRAWEEDYCQRGILWSGQIRYLPELPPASRVLELGCGNGKTVSAMIRRGWDVTAVDFSSRAVAFCGQAFSDLSHGQAMIADARWSPFRDAVFDAVFAVHVTGHMPAPDRKRIAGEVIRLLKPGGMLFFCEFSPDDFRFGKGHETEEATFRRGNGIITHYFSEPEVDGLFSGLTPVSVNTHRWPMRVRGCSLVRSEITAVFTR